MSHLCEKMASCIGSHSTVPLLLLLVSTPCAVVTPFPVISPLVAPRCTDKSILTFFSPVMTPVHPGSITMVLMSSMTKAGPGMECPGDSPPSRYAGVDWRPPRSKYAVEVDAGGGKGGGLVVMSCIYHSHTQVYSKMALDYKTTCASADIQRGTKPMQ